MKSKKQQIHLDQALFIYLYQPENHKNLHYFFYCLTPLTKSN